MKNQKSLQVDAEIHSMLEDYKARYNFSTKAAIWVLLTKEDVIPTPQEIHNASRKYPSLSQLSRNWDSYWECIKNHINSDLEGAWLIESFSEVAGCSVAQAQSLIDNCVEVGILLVLQGKYVLKGDDPIKLTLKQLREKSFNIRAESIIDLVKQHPEGLCTEEIKEELGYSNSWMKGSMKNPLIRSCLVVNEDNWVYTEAPKKRRKAPVKRRKKVSKTS